MPALKDNPFRGVLNDSSDPLLLALATGGRRRWWFLNAPIRDLDPVRFSPCRCSSPYQHRRHYSGTYPFGPNRVTTTFESLTELRCLMELDHGGEVEDVVAQPFGLVFSDRTLHYPDFAVRLRNGSTVIIDVKPAELSTGDAFVHAAVLTEKACSTQKWVYRIMHGCSGWRADNLEWMCAFRYAEYVPESARAQNVLAFLSLPHTMEEAALRLDPRKGLGVGYALLSNMLFNRQVVPAEPGPFYPGLMVIAGQEDGGAASSDSSPGRSAVKCPRESTDIS